MDSQEQKKSLEESLQTKQKSLDTLKSKTLSEQEKSEKEKIEAEVEEIQKKLEELKKIEKDVTSQKTKKETESLKEDFAVSLPEQTLEILKNTTMYTKLLDILHSEIEVKKFALQIDTTVRNYLQQSFALSSEKNELSVSHDVINAMSVGIQFAMMETLTTTGSQGVNFLQDFGNLDVSDGNSAFSGFLNIFGGGGIFSSVGKIFGGVQKLTGFQSLANRVQNCIAYVAKKSGPGKELSNGLHYQVLATANGFRKLLANPLWDDRSCMTKTSQELGILYTENLDKEQGEQELKQIAQNENLPITEKSLAAIQHALPTAQKFLEKRITYKEKALDLMGKVGNILNINILGLGTFGSLLGIKNPADILKNPKKGEKRKVLDFVLTALGFQGGTEGLHREYIQQSLERDLHNHPQEEEKKQIITAGLAAYAAEVGGPTGISTLKKFSLEALEESQKAKIPSAYDLLKKSLLESISGKEVFLNPFILKSLGVKLSPTTVKNQENKDIVIIDSQHFDTSQINDAFIEKYLTQWIPLFAKNTDFMGEIQTPQDFTLALLGTLVGGEAFGEGMLLGLESASQYLSQEKRAEKQSSPVVPSDVPRIKNGEITKDTTDYNFLVGEIIDKLEGGYYHPQMLKDGRVRDKRYKASGETMMGIDRKNGGGLNTSPAGKAFWNIIDTAHASRVWNLGYRGGFLEPQLRKLAGDIIHPHYENLAQKYLSPQSLRLVNADGRLLFNFIYGAWNGGEWFREMADVLNADVAAGVRDTEKLLQHVVDFRVHHANSLIAQGGRKIAEIVGVI